MATLKELRIDAGLNQSQVAELIKASIPDISNYENNVELPNLEDAAILEKRFGKIEWQEKITPVKKQNIVNSLIKLAEHFPLPMVLEFGARSYRRNAAPEGLITFYAKFSTTDEQPPLLPPNVTRTK